MWAFPNHAIVGGTDRTGTILVKGQEKQEAKVKSANVGKAKAKPQLGELKMFRTQRPQQSQGQQILELRERDCSESAGRGYGFVIFYASQTASNSFIILS